MFVVWNILKSKGKNFINLEVFNCWVRLFRFVIGVLFNCKINLNICLYVIYIKRLFFDVENI